MKILLIAKYPPLIGGESAKAYWTALSLAQSGHDVHVVSNTTGADPGYLALLDSQTKIQAINPNALGAVTVHRTEAVRKFSYIPWAEPMFSATAGCALDVARQHGCDVVFGWYLEPNGVVAHWISKILNVPLVIRHAGSDMGALSPHSNLNAVYKRVMCDADLVLSGGSHVDTLLRWGVNSDRISASRSFQLPKAFKSANEHDRLTEPLTGMKDWMNFNSLDIGDLFDNAYLPDVQLRQDNGPIIGVMGKCGKFKSLDSLFASLNQLAKDGLEFGFRVMLTGRVQQLRQRYHQLSKLEHLWPKTCILPPQLPWNVPNFLNSCDLVCHLEHDFPIPHLPQQAREILSSRSALMCSKEIAAKPSFKDALIHNKNAFVVDDPTDNNQLQSELRLAIESPDLIRTVSDHGRGLSKFMESRLPTTTPLHDLLKNVLHG